MSLAEKHRGRVETPFDDTERLARVRLLRSENVGPITFHALIERYGTGVRALKALPALARRGGKRAIRIYSRQDAIDELAAAERAGVSFIWHGEPDYPETLGCLPDAPPFISALGRVELLHRPTIAIVGARNASAAGRQFTRTLAGELGEAGIVVVSGLARGIDTAAHTGALGTGTAAVVAGGTDVVYPPENDTLHRRIGEEGILLAEQPVGTRPQARHFPTRNRLISGLSLGVIVVEAASRSGSLITSRCALEQGREVFAVPGSPLDPRCHGSNSLLRDGAILVQSAADVTSVLLPMTAPRQPSAPPPTPPVEHSDNDDETFAESRKRVLLALGPTPISIDELVRECQLTPSALLTILLELETAGRLHRHSGNRVSFL